MNQNDSKRHQDTAGGEHTRGHEDNKPGQGGDFGEQREDQVGRERERKQPDAEQQPGGNRENLNR